jgi:predicted SAM-dependent methyltransferase
MHGTKMLNIGCGSTHHPDWINLDVSSVDPSVLEFDIKNGLPFTAESVTVCYSSHLLEHLDKEAAPLFLAECMRVLQSGGVIRLVVPDLEVIAREYLRLVAVAAAGDKSSESAYDWIMLEMYDQAVRNHSGGEMAGFLANLNVHDRPYVMSRIGAEAEKVWAKRCMSTPSILSSLVVRNPLKILKPLHIKCVGWVVFLLAGRLARKSFLAGVFRSSGEIHQWMYDRYSLKRLLVQAGFVDAKICDATESRIPEYEKYSLDALNGAPRKPDSIYIEASKP